MTDLGDLLRRALNAEAAQVRTSPDALHLIRARTRRPPLAGPLPHSQGVPMKQPQIQLNDPAILTTRWAEAQSAEDLAAQQRAVANRANDEATDLVRQIKEAEDALEGLKADCNARIKERNDNADAAKANEVFAADQRTMVRLTAEAVGLPVPADLPAVNVLPPQDQRVSAGDPATTQAMAALTAAGRKS